MNNPTEMNVKPLPYDQATPKQVNAIERTVSYRLERAGVEVPSYHGYPVATPEQVIGWLNRHYGDYLQEPLQSMGELDKDTASAILTRLLDK